MCAAVESTATQLYEQDNYLSYWGFTLLLGFLKSGYPSKNPHCIRSVKYLYIYIYVYIYIIFFNIQICKDKTVKTWQFCTHKAAVTYSLAMYKPTVFPIKWVPCWAFISLFTTLCISDLNCLKQKITISNGGSWFLPARTKNLSVIFNSPSKPLSWFLGSDICVVSKQHLLASLGIACASRETFLYWWYMTKQRESGVICNDSPSLQIVACKSLGMTWMLRLPLGEK